MHIYKLFVGTGLAALVAGAGTTAHAQNATPANSSASAASSDVAEIVVTARRRSENQQTVPVSVTGLSSTALVEKNVQTLQDINNIVPGFRLGAEGGRDNTDVILRGLSKLPLGIGIPAVVTYVGDVPLPGVASNVPIYDLENIQVLKGPQGTLFGRNTLGGAVVLTPTKPDNDFGGYFDAQGGNLGRYSFEGAVTLPIVQDKLSVRLAGQLLRGDGYVKNLNAGPDLSNTNVNSGRVTVLFQPTDYIKNTTIFDYSVTPQTNAGEWLFKANPGVFTALFTPAFGSLASYVGNSLDAQLAAALKASGPRSQFTDPFSKQTILSRGYGVSNDTRFTIDDNLQVRNIFGYRYVYSDAGADVTATPLLTLNFPPSSGIPSSPFYVFDANQLLIQKFITDEFQVIGKAWNNHLSWIVGGFYNTDSPGGPGGTHYNSFGASAPYITSVFKDENTAVYGQGGLDLSDWVLKGLSVDLGYRYSWDQQKGCGGAINGGTAFATWDQCAGSAPNSVVIAQGNDPSWTVGLDYKYSDDQFFYLETRRGYRGVNVNVPFFSSIYTTGGSSSACALTGGTCLDLRPLQTTKAEKLTDIEIGSKTDWSYGGMRGRVDIALYRSWYKNGLQFENFSGLVPTIAPDAPNANSVGITDNNQTITGVELGTTFRPTPGLTFSFNGAYTNATITSVYSPSPYLKITKADINLPTPKFSGTLGTRWILPYNPFEGSLVFSADVFGTSSFGASSPTRFPGYFLADSRLSLQGVANTNLDVSFFVKNMFDRTYLLSPVVVLPTFPAEVGITGTPRTFGADLRYTF